MYYKVIILEIKENYCLAMTEDGMVIRIVKKEGLQEGDKVYVLDEDLHQGETADEKARASQVVVPFTKNKKVKKSSLQKITAVAAAVLVCLASLMIPQMTDPAYAAVSFDGDKSVQVELDERGKVIDAVSFDDTMSDKELDRLIGKDVTELQDMAAGLNKKDDDLIVVAYANLAGSESDKSLIKSHLDDLMKERETLYIEGDEDDVKAAKKAGKSLGMYMIEKAASEDRLEDILDGVPFDHIVKFLKNHGDLIPTEKAKKILKDQEEKAKGGDKEKSYYKNDDDDDGDDDDDDDRIAAPGKKDHDDDDGDEEEED